MQDSNKHVLFDSWFSAPTTLVAISKLNLFVVAMMKITSSKGCLKVSTVTSNRYTQNSRSALAGPNILPVLRLWLTNTRKTAPIPAKLVFVRDRVNKKKWLVLVSTDVSLSPEEIIELYGIRWDIEVFFKVNKSFLRLTKEFQGQSFEIQNRKLSSHLPDTL